MLYFVEKKKNNKLNQNKSELSLFLFNLNTMRMHGTYNLKRHAPSAYYR